jgi:Polyketide cyclase / dehydrase and lipid transport
MKKIAPYTATMAASFALATSAMAGASIDVTYKAPADELWKLVEFHQPSENIMPPVESSELVGNGVGARKLAALKGGGELELQLVYFDPKSKAFNYVIRSSPLPLKNYVGEVRVEAVGDGRSKLIWSGAFDPDGVERAKADETVQGFYESIAGRIAEKFPRE